MRTDLDTLESQVLKPVPADRSRPLERLGASLGPDPELELTWSDEADRREFELDIGAVAAAPSPGAIVRLRARLAR